MSSVLRLIKLTLIASVVSVTFGDVAFGSQICFTDYNNWLSVRAQLPRFMQSGEIYGVHKSGLMVGAFRVTRGGQHFLIEAKGRHKLAGKLDDKAWIQQGCVNGNRLTVRLSNGLSETLTFDNSSVRMRGHSFQLTNAATYQETLARVQRYQFELEIHGFDLEPEFSEPEL